MNLLLVKQGGVILLSSLNAVLLGWALLAHRQKRGMPGGYYRLLPISAAIGLFQVGMGLFFLWQGRVVMPMHLFYGTLVGSGAIAQLLLRPGSGLGQQYRGKPLVHAALALFVGLLAARSWMAG